MRRGGSVRLAAGIPAWSIRLLGSVNLSRSSGVQLHPTSLPGGRLGPDAYAWIDWLAEAGQAWWQMLPLGPPDRVGSPYKARSAFAASPRLLADRRGPGAASEALGLPRRAAGRVGGWGCLRGG